MSFRWPFRSLCLAAGLAAGGSIQPARAQEDAGCQPYREATSAAEWLDRAVRSTGVDARGGRPLGFAFVDEQVLADQSDRTYPPYIHLPSSGHVWYQPATGVERTTGTTLTPFGAFSPPSTVADDRATYVVSHDTLVPQPASHAASLRARRLNAWAVLHDWRAAGDVRVAGLCRYRGVVRVVLGREAPDGAERLFLARPSGLPVKLETTAWDPTQLWGRERVEYVYSTWWEIDGSLMAATSYRIVDGVTATIRTVGPSASGDTVPDLTLPADAPDMRSAPTVSPDASRPDTVRVGPATVLLRTRYYTNVVTLVGDTVYVLDAQYPGDARARADSAWIARLFPGRHPLVLVVSDLAWQHVAGVRYWVARGATIVSQRLSRAFLERVVARRWTGTPDLLERRRRRGAVTFRFRAVDDSLSLAGGALRVYTIGGIGSETSLMAYLPRDHFLFASDYIQGVDAPSEYAREVRAAVERTGIAPERVAAMHLPLTSWHVVDSVLGAEADTGTPSPPPVVPGDSAVHPERLALGTVTKRLLWVRGDSAVDVGTDTQRLALVTVAGVRGLLSVQTVTGNGGTIVDSAFGDPRTLRPLWHHSHGPSRAMRLTFDRAHVTGRYVPTDGTVKTVDQHLDAPPFDSNVTDLVIAALPLTRGYRVRLPTYVYEHGGLVWNDVAVVDADTADSKVTWRVTATGPAADVTYWIRQRPRAVVRSEYVLPDGTVYRYER